MRKKYFHPAAHASLVADVQRCLGPHCLHIKMKRSTGKTLAECTDAQADQELLPFPQALCINCTELSKHSLFAYPYHLDQEDMPLEQYDLCLFRKYVWIFTVRTRKIWWWISSDSRGAYSFRSLLFAQLCFLRIPNANCEPDLDIHRQSILRHFLFCQNRASLKQLRSR